MTDRSVPSGVDRAALLDSLRSISIDGSESGSLAPYVEQDLDRFLLTFNLARVTAKDVLEIGSNPYFLTVLLKWFRPHLELKLLNFFGQEQGVYEQRVRVLKVPAAGLANAFLMQFASANVESQPMPFEDESFDLVFFCEVLEHFTADPYGALLEIRRVLRTGGHLLLTTPNVARLENVARLLNGHNIYDPYSGHGPHGRHNREYTRHEIAWLLTGLGFEPVAHFTENVHPLQISVDPSSLALPAGREHDFGQYQFHLWRKRDARGRAIRPAWLYRNIPGELDLTPL